MKLWKTWRPQLKREFLSLVIFQDLRELNEILTKFLTLVHAKLHSHHTISVLETTIFFPVRFHKMKQSTPWTEILSPFKLHFHPGKSACQPWQQGACELFYHNRLERVQDRWMRYGKWVFQWFTSPLLLWVVFENHWPSHI